MSESRVRENRTHGSIGGRWRHGTNLRGRWSRAGALKYATTSARSGPRPQQHSAEPAAYLTVDLCCPGADIGHCSAWPIDGGSMVDPKHADREVLLVDLVHD